MCWRAVARVEAGGGTTVFDCYVPDPVRCGVIAFDAGDQIAGLEEITFHLGLIGADRACALAIGLFRSLMARRSSAGLWSELMAWRAIGFRTVGSAGGRFSPPARLLVPFRFQHDRLPACLCLAASNVFGRFRRPEVWPCERFITVLRGADLSEGWERRTHDRHMADVGSDRNPMRLRAASVPDNACGSHDGRSDRPLRRSLASRCALLAGSVAFIWLIAGSVWILAFILAIVIASYGMIVAADVAFCRPATRVWVGNLFVVLVFGGLIAANVSGRVGTLTGTPASLQEQLPLFLGVSFYALQIGGVSSDLFRGLIPRPTMLGYLVFVLLGFKFYSGPLERAIDLDRIVNQTCPMTLKSIWDGFSWAVLGLFFKFVIANPLAPLIELDTSDPLSTVLVATLAELRIYFDFAGYSFLAVGLAKFAGIDLTLNFQQPLYAPNIAEFWRRWHVSIGRWLRHYIYLPLRDRARRSQIPTLVVAPIVFLVSALWHGATFNFALWGVIHAAAFVLYTRVLAKWQWPPALGHFALISLLIFVRLLYIDADADRLADKLLAFGDPVAWSGSIDSAGRQIQGLTRSGGVAIALALVVLALEAISARLYGTLDYALFRSIGAVSLMIVLILGCAHAQPEAIFVYARN